MRRVPNWSGSTRGNGFRGCRFCGGGGCLACDGESKKAYGKAFPDGPKPLLAVAVGDDGKLAGPEAEVLKEVFSKQALTHAFSGEGEGMREVLARLAEAKTKHGIGDSEE